jgi:hypothetical protein
MTNGVTEVGEEERSILLCEYQAAQASAEHHDGIIWVVTSIIWGASLVLLGLAVDHAAKPELRLHIVGLALLAIFLHCFLLRVHSQFRTLKNQKYERCKAIEGRLKYMSHHIAVGHKQESQTIWYRMIQFLFILAWGIMAIVVLCRGAC